MNLKLKGVVEGLLFASGHDGITIEQLATVIEVTPETIKEIIASLQADYELDQRGMTILQSNEVYHLTTKPEHNKYFKKLLHNPRTTRMSQAVLETLAIIAYKQPITKVEVEDIRGVNSDYAVQTLMARSLIEETGRKDTIGRPKLYGTTTEFLTYFGLSSMDDLPALPEEVDEASVEQEANLFFERFTDKD
ncbi:MAG TPA: SMC-Scp complex subunit ScpB [Pseudogracilibacillus sp.]|nr:SMC-Scp complex subunit ScpB [Pseudogracilibacillus sp.]